MARLWDVKSGELLGSFKGHLCSLKSVAFTPEEKGNISPTQHVLRVKAYIVYKIEEKAGFHKYKQLFVFMKNIAQLILIISSVVLFNSCVLYWGQRWEHYGLGYQMQQKRYLFNTELEQNWGIFMGIDTPSFYILKNICDRFTFPHRWLLQTGQADQRRSQQG